MNNDKTLRTHALFTSDNVEDTESRKRLRLRRFFQNILKDQFHDMLKFSELNESTLIPALTLTLISTSI